MSPMHGRMVFIACACLAILLIASGSISQADIGAHDQIDAGPFKALYPMPEDVSGQRQSKKPSGAPTAVTGNNAVSPGDHIFKILLKERDRRYTVHVPPGYDGTTPVPVVVMLHGGGGTSRAAATETGWGTKADKEGFLAIFPDAMARDPSQPGSFRKNPQCWNDGSDRFFNGQQAPDDVAFLNAMLDELLAKFAVDARRIYFTGFSNGASMTFRVGAELSRRIAAIAPVAGACWLKPLKLEQAIPMCYIGGTADPLNPLNGGGPKFVVGGNTLGGKEKAPVRDSIQKWAQAIGCPAVPKETSEANGVRIETYGPGHEGVEMMYVIIEGLGHTWAGGKSLLPEFMVGKKSDKIKATDFIWDFFQNKRVRQNETKH